MASDKPRFRLSTLSMDAGIGSVWQILPWGERYVGYFWHGKFWPIYPGCIK